MKRLRHYVINKQKQLKSHKNNFNVIYYIKYIKINTQQIATKTTEIFYLLNQSREKERERES